MGVMTFASAAAMELVEARAALVRMRAEAHGGSEECGPLCADYHQAMRSVTRAAECIGMPVITLDELARAHNRREYDFTEELPYGC